MKKKRIILSLLVVAVIGGGWFGYGEYSRKVKDLSKVKASVVMQVDELITRFEINEAEANKQLLDKIIAVKGTVRMLEKNDRGHQTIVLGEAGSMSSVRCSMDSVHVKDLQLVKEGDLITVKGACTGFTQDELLGSDVILNRCVLEKQIQ
jgi:hypothetical protein